MYALEINNKILPRYTLKPDQIILYGQSIGTAPTVDLASKYVLWCIVVFCIVIWCYEHLCTVTNVVLGWHA